MTTMTQPANQQTNNEADTRRKTLMADLVDLDAVLRSHDELLDESMTWLLQRRELVRLTAELAELAQLPESVLGFTEREHGAFSVRVWRSKHGRPIYVLHTKAGQAVGITEDVEVIEGLSELWVACDCADLPVAP